MLDINLIRENPELVRKNLERRKDPEKIKWVDELTKIDTEWRKLKHQTDNLRSERNKISEEINQAKKQGKDIKALLKKAKKIPEELKEDEKKLETLWEKEKHYLMRLPNM